MCVRERQGETERLCVCVFVCTHICAWHPHLWRPEDNLEGHLQKWHPSSLRQGLPLTRSSPIRLNWLGLNGKDSPVTAFPVLGLQGHATKPGIFIRVLGIELGSSFLWDNCFTDRTISFFPVLGSCWLERRALGLAEITCWTKKTKQNKTKTKQNKAKKLFLQLSISS